MCDAVGTPSTPPAPGPAKIADPRWRYAVMTSPGVFVGFEKLTEALEYRERMKKTCRNVLVFEPMPMTAIELLDLRERLATAESALAAVLKDREGLIEELKLWKPLTPAEAERALDEAEAVPLSDERIASIVAFATDPANAVDNKSSTAMAAEIRRLSSALAESRAAAGRMREWMNRAADRLVPVAGELMRRACFDSDEHFKGCDCNTCRAFLDVQAMQNEIEAALAAPEPEKRNT